MSVRHCRRSIERAALTLVEIVIATSLLAIVLLAFGMLATTSVDAASAARPNFIAQEAANRLVEQMRTAPVIVPNSPPDGTSVFESYYTNYAYKVTIGGVQWAAPDLDTPASYALSTPYADFAALQQAFRRGLLGRPSDAPARPLRVRFLDEAEYQSVFGLPAAVDLDLNGAATVGVTNSYQLFPVVVEVRWREERGPDRVYQVKTVLAAQASLNPNR